MNTKTNSKACRKYRQSEKGRATMQTYLQSERGKTIIQNGYLRRKKENPVRTRAYNMKMRMRWGRGATDRMELLLRQALGKPCKWCKVKITVDNASLDHRRPFNRRHQEQYSNEEVKFLNSEENLQMICKKCNGVKGNIPEEKFEKLMNWLNDDSELKSIIIARLRGSSFTWSH